MEITVIVDREGEKRLLEVLAELIGVAEDG